MIRALILILIPCLLFSQDVPVGQWKDYLAYNKTTDVAIAQERIYCVAQGGLFYYDKNDNSINRISKINGLSDKGVKKIKYNNYNNSLIIIYENCNVDILKNDQIFNISDIKRKEITGIKEINNIYFDQNLTYLSCSFGVVVLDLMKNETKDTYKIGDNGNFKSINQTLIINDKIYVATSEGIYSAEKNNLFLSNSGEWTKDILFMNENLINENFISINNLNGKVITFVDLEKDSILIKNNKWEVLSNNTFLKPDVEEKAFGLIISDSNRVVLLNNDYVFNEIIGMEDACSSDGANNEELWIADKTNGLIKFLDGEIDQEINVNSPKSNDIYSLEYINNKLFICHGGHMNFSVNTLNNDGVSFSENDDWKISEISHEDT